MADKRNATAGDLIRSMAVVLIPILLLTWLLTSNPEDYPVEAVDWRPVLETARAEMEWPVQAPEGLPEGENAWLPSRVSFVRQGERATGGEVSPRNQWRLGLLSPDKVYFEVNQGDDELDDLVRSVTRDGRRVGDEPIQGTSWERWESQDGRTRSLVLREDPTVTLVVADAEFIELQQFARTLQAS